MNTVTLLRFSSAAARFADGLIAAMGVAEISTPLRQCHFLAQLAHESAGFTRVIEGLNYSSDALRKLWPHRFPEELADDYARKPERIANRVYADRLGNGPEASGDGWRYRGRGLIQLTGKDNYRRASLAIYNGATLVQDPDQLAQPGPACTVAGWFWTDHSLNRWADQDDLEQITRRVNGGLNGLEDRREWLERAKQEFA